MIFVVTIGQISERRHVSVKYKVYIRHIEDKTAKNVRLSECVIPR